MNDIGKAAWMILLTLAIGKMGAIAAIALLWPVLVVAGLTGLAILADNRRPIQY